MTSGRVSIDLHWHLHYSTEDRRPYALDPDAMLRRRRPAVGAGLEVPTLDAVDTVLTLAFHAARSDGHRLVWLKDIERAVVVGQPDLDELVRRCRAARCAPAVGMMLGRARHTIDADIPDEIVRSLTPVALRAADYAVGMVQRPLQLHDRPTLNRVFTRSVRSSLGASLTEMPKRTVRLLRRRLRGPVPSETDSPEEKASYVAAVGRRPTAEPLSRRRRQRAISSTATARSNGGPHGIVVVYTGTSVDEGADTVEVPRAARRAGPAVDAGEGEEANRALLGASESRRSEVAVRDGAGHDDRGQRVSATGGAW